MTKNKAPERQLDFWLGDWEVSWGEDQQGTNRIERILDIAYRTLAVKFDLYNRGVYNTNKIYTY